MLKRQAGGIGVDVVTVVVVLAVVPIDVAVLIGRGCKTDGCCNTKYGGFVKKRSILETLKIKWKTKTTRTKTREVIMMAATGW